MKRLTTGLIIGFIVFLLASCATVEDVQRATDLIRTDNELTRLLIEVRPSDKAGAATFLSGLATHAKSEADDLKDDQARTTDAIAYYRIASIAYWKSGKPEVVNALFEVTNSGTDLCNKLGNQAPDRDCLFLRLVIPFAGLESIANSEGPFGSIDSIKFSDGNASTEDIETMVRIRDSLNQAKPMVEKIFTVGKDDRLLSHPGMRKYYCDNAQKALGFYNSTAAVFELMTEEYHENFPNDAPALGITINDAAVLRKLEEAVPSFCQ